MTVYRLDDKIKYFPDPLSIPESERDPNGMFAVGGDLSTERLLEAYSQGIFPWTSFRDSDELHWYCPLERFVIFPSEIHISHSMRTLLNKGSFTVTIDSAFEDVIGNCSSLRIDMEGAWLGPAMIEAYTRLHRLGYAHSVEVWDKENKLVGGLYGVGVGRTFVGESMFSLVPSGSKVALIFLAKWLEKNGGKMIDCQIETPHLKSMGGRHISYKEYLDILYS